MELGNLLEEEIKCWVQFGDDGEVLLKYLPSEELTRVIRKATKKNMQKGQPVEELDRIVSNRLLGRAAVMDWSNLTVGGNPFLYSPENCDLLMAKSYEFAAFVNEKCVEISNFMAEQEKSSKKKSSITPAGG